MLQITALNMNTSQVRQRLARGETVFCAKACYHDPEVVELIGRFGFDGIWICLEHKQVDPAALYALLQACRLAGTDAIVRLKPSNYSQVISLLEAGAPGLMLPRVRTVDEVREIVAAMKFPPLGRRGFDGVHADADFGLAAPADYMAHANRETFLVVQVEEPEVVPHLDAIAALSGVDVLFVGPADLSNALGVFGNWDSPAVLKIIEAVAAAARRHGKVAGIPCQPEAVPRYRDMGYGFFNVVSDYGCLARGLKQTAAELAGLGFGGLDGARVAAAEGRAMRPGTTIPPATRILARRRRTAP